MPALAHNEHYTWTFPGAPVRVRLSLDLVRRLRPSLTDGAITGDSDQGGILIDRPEGGGGIEISDAMAFFGDPIDSLPVLLRAYRNSNDLAPVGFYRTQSAEPLEFRDEDLRTASDYFFHPTNVFLILQCSRSGPGNGTFYFWDNGQIHRDIPFPEFPFDPSALASRERSRLAARQSDREQEPVPPLASAALTKAAVPAPPPLPQLAAQAEPQFHPPA